MNTNAAIDRRPAQRTVQPSATSRPRRAQRGNSTSKPRGDLPKLLVVTYYAPDTQHGGAVCVRRLLTDYPRDRLVWLHHDAPAVDATAPGSDVRQWSVPLLRRPTRFGLTPVRDAGNWMIQPARIARRVEGLAQTTGIQAVLGIGPGLSIRTSHLIAKRLHVPLHLWIHDDPVAHAEMRGVPSALCRWIGERFRDAYRVATVRHVISPAMRELYREQTGCDACFLPPSLSGRGETEKGTTTDGPLRIGFAGSLIDPSSWERFLMALDRVDSKPLRGRSLEIVVFADPSDVPIPARIRDRGWVRVHGWQPEEIVQRKLAGMDFLYQSLWFSPLRRRLTETSFSTKFVSYLPSNVPILCHVPAYSAVAEFVRQHPVGPILDTTDVSQLAERLRSALFDEPWQRWRAQVQPQVLAAFDRDRLAGAFHERLIAAHRSHRA